MCTGPSYEIVRYTHTWGCWLLFYYLPPSLASSSCNYFAFCTASLYEYFAVSLWRLSGACVFFLHLLCMKCWGGMIEYAVLPARYIKDKYFVLCLASRDYAICNYVICFICLWLWWSIGCPFNFFYDLSGVILTKLSTQLFCMTKFGYFVYESNGI